VTSLERFNVESIRGDHAASRMITEDQAAIVAFLSSASTHGGAPLERIETHASVVFLDRVARVEAQACGSLRLPGLFDCRSPQGDGARVEVPLDFRVQQAS
jgi:hypothetical protein